jgi:hypothetical protein
LITIKLQRTTTKQGLLFQNDHETKRNMYLEYGYTWEYSLGIQHLGIQLNNLNIRIFSSSNSTGTIKEKHFATQNKMFKLCSIKR